VKTLTFKCSIEIVVFVDVIKNSICLCRKCRVCSKSSPGRQAGSCIT